MAEVGQARTDIGVDMMAGRQPDQGPGFDDGVECSGGTGFHSHNQSQQTDQKIDGAQHCVATETSARWARSALGRPLARQALRERLS
jgi:hypothetical protein